MEIDKGEGGKSRVANWITVSLSNKSPQRELETFSFRSLISFMCTILPYFVLTFGLHFQHFFVVVGEC